MSVMSSYCFHVCSPYVIGTSSAIALYITIRLAVVMYFHCQTCGVPTLATSLCFYPVSFSLCGCVSGTVEALTEVGIHNIVSFELYVQAQVVRILLSICLCLNPSMSEIIFFFLESKHPARFEYFINSQFAFQCIRIRNCINEDIFL